MKKKIYIALTLTGAVIQIAVMVRMCIWGNNLPQNAGSLGYFVFVLPGMALLGGLTAGTILCIVKFVKLLKK